MGPSPGPGPGGFHCWQRQVRYRGIPGCMAGGASERVHRPASGAQPPNVPNRPIQCPACPAVRVRYSGVLSYGGDSGLPGRAIRVVLRGLQQAAIGDGTPRAAQVGLQGVQEQALSAPSRRCPAGEKPLPDAIATHGPGADEPGGHHHGPGTAVLLPISHQSQSVEGLGWFSDGRSRYANRHRPAGPVPALRVLYPPGHADKGPPLQRCGVVHSRLRCCDGRTQTELFRTPSSGQSVSPKDPARKGPWDLDSSSSSGRPRRRSGEEELRVTLNSCADSCMPLGVG